RVVSLVHRRRASVACPALEDQLAAGIAHDAGDDPERRARALEHRALLDVKLEERIRQRVSARRERPASDAADLLSAEGNHGPGTRPLHGLDPGDDAERAVELPAP